MSPTVRLNLERTTTGLQEIIGALSSSSERDVEIIGALSSSSERDVEIIGALSSSSERDVCNLNLCAPMGLHSLTLRYKYLTAI